METKKWKILEPGDEARIERFLRRHSLSSLRLISNIQLAGLKDEGQRDQATYAAKMEKGKIAGVVAHLTNGQIILQAPTDADKLSRFVAQQTGRDIAGVSGPSDQVEAVRGPLGIDKAATNFDGREILYAMNLDELEVPFSDVPVEASIPKPQDLQTIANWRMQFLGEALSFPQDESQLQQCKDDVQVFQDMGRHFCLYLDDKPVAYCAYTACAPGFVQVGCVFTPQEYRGKGYARCVVAGALINAQIQGVETAVFYAPKDNVAAQKLYAAIGLQPKGEHGLINFRDHIRL